MSIETAPLGPPINSEMVTRHPTFEGDRQDQLDLSALAADAIHNPDASGHVEVINNVENGRPGYQVITSYDVTPLPVSDPNTESPTVRFTINKSVTQGLDYDVYGRPGSVELVIDGGGRVKHAYAQSITGGYNSPIEKHELSSADAKNAASEAIAVIKAHKTSQKSRN